MTLPPKDLVIDVGNTRLKAALFMGAAPVRWTRLPSRDIGSLKAWVGADAPRHIAVGSVATPDPLFEQGLAAWAPCLFVTGASPAPDRKSVV